MYAYGVSLDIQRKVVKRMPKPPSPAEPPRREPLSRERVLAAAMAIADERGLEALTMRGLARVLGVEPMSLYHYAASRDDIVDAIVELVVEEFEIAPDDGDWKAAIRASAVSAHRVLRLHSWACNPLMSARRIQPARLRHIDAILRRLADAALPDRVLDLTYHAIDSHILGFTLWEAGYSSGLSRIPADGIEDFLRELHIEDYPDLMAHARYHMTPRAPGGPTEFEFGLDLILDGAERLRDGAAAG
jgi:AcrR family transcriptional regulator